MIYNLEDGREVNRERQTSYEVSRGFDYDIRVQNSCRKAVN